MSACESIPNIDPAAFRKGEYVGYCNGAHAIVRWGTGWITGALRSSQGAPIRPPIKARTLEEMGEKLAALKKKICPTSE